MASGPRCYDLPCSQFHGLHIAGLPAAGNWSCFTLWHGMQRPGLRQMAHALVRRASAACAGAAFSLREVPCTMTMALGGYNLIGQLRVVGLIAHLARDAAAEAGSASGSP